MSSVNCTRGVNVRGRKMRCFHQCGDHRVGGWRPGRVGCKIRNTSVSKLRFGRSPDFFCSKKYILPHTRGTRQARGRPRGGCQNLIKNDQFLKNKCRAFEEQCHTLFAGIFVTRPFFCDFVQSLHQGLAFLAHTYSKIWHPTEEMHFF